MAATQDKSAYISLADAAEHSPYSQEYLSLRARQGKLRALKQGRTWYTTLGWLDDYMDSVEAAKAELKEVSVATHRPDQEFSYHPAATTHSLNELMPKHEQADRLELEPVHSVLKGTNYAADTDNQPIGLYERLRSKVDAQIENSPVEMKAVESQISESRLHDKWLVDGQPEYVVALLAKPTRIEESEGRTAVQATEEQTNASADSFFAQQSDADFDAILNAHKAQKQAKQQENWLDKKISLSLDLNALARPAMAVAIVFGFFISYALLDKPLELSKSIAIGWQMATGSASQPFTVIADSTTPTYLTADQAAEAELAAITSDSIENTDSYNEYETEGQVAGQATELTPTQAIELSTNPVDRAFQTMAYGAYMISNFFNTLTR